MVKTPTKEFLDLIESTKVTLEHVYNITGPAAAYVIETVRLAYAQGHCEQLTDRNNWLEKQLEDDDDDDNNEKTNPKTPIPSAFLQS